MKKVAIAVFVLMLPLIALFSGIASSSTIVPVVRILPDGSISPAGVSIQRSADLYTFTGNVYARIVVERDNVVINGAGYTLQGNYNGTRTDSWTVGEGPDQEINETAVPWTIGIDLANSNLHNLTVRNLNIKNFYIGTYIWTSNNTITGCSVSDNIVGILLSGDSNAIMKNYISGNEQGIFFGVNQPGNDPLNIVLTHNSFVNNDVHFSGCFCDEVNTTEPVHTWDNGREGNYWDDYNGTDADGDGIGDTPYVIDVQNLDRYPLMQNTVTSPTTTSKTPVEALIVSAILLITAAVGVIAYRKRRRKVQT